MSNLSADFGVSEFLDLHQLHCSVKDRYIDLVSETGELGKEILTCSDYGKQAFALTDKMIDEMGDSLFSILALCAEMGIDPESAVKQSLEKYRKRLKEKGTAGSS